jgi:hypothetical protein
VNAYYAVYLLGSALGAPLAWLAPLLASRRSFPIDMTEMADFGRLLLATEIRSAKKYWQITSRNNIYDQEFAANKARSFLCLFSLSIHLLLSL